MVFGDVGVHHATEVVIDQRLLLQRHANTPDHAAHDLAACRLRVRMRPGCDRADNAGDANDAQLLDPLSPRRRPPSEYGAACSASFLELRGTLLLNLIDLAVTHTSAMLTASAESLVAQCLPSLSETLVRFRVSELRIRHLLAARLKQLLANRRAGVDDGVPRLTPPSTIRPRPAIAVMSNHRASTVTFSSGKPSMSAAT